MVVEKRKLLACLPLFSFLAILCVESSILLERFKIQVLVIFSSLVSFFKDVK